MEWNLSKLLKDSDIVLKDSDIVLMDFKTLFSPQILLELYDIDDELERIRITALLQARAKQLEVEKEFTSVISAYNKANQKIVDEHVRLCEVDKLKIPLVMDNKNRVAETISNFLLVLRNDEHFNGIAFNLLSHSPERHSDKGVELWDDNSDSWARNYIEKKYKLYSPVKLDDALRILFKERAYHPIKDIIEGTKWDGIERIPTLLIKWLNCEDSLYTREISRLIFAGGINRLYNNGCKFDDVVVFIGTKQGEGKSTFVRWLALKDEFFNEVVDIEGQRGMEAVKGAWICEMAELLALTKVKEVEAVKSYIARLVDVYRQPYERRVSKFKRQCIFIGTTNKEQFLTDKTGNRRWYPIRVNQSGYDLFANKDKIKSDILQCWAEAKVKYDKGQMPPYSDQSLMGAIKENQNNAVEDDYRVGLITGYLKNRTEVCVLELWKHALYNDYSKPTKRDSNDIVLILQGLKDWEREPKPKRTQNYGLQKVWVKKQVDITILEQLVTG